MKIDFEPSGPVCRAFMESEHRVRGLRGPIGSGKSVGCAAELMRCATLQGFNEAGVRKSRWAVVRNTNPELRTTTIKTWLDWFPEDPFGKFRWQPPYTHAVYFQLPDHTIVDAEVIFLALDRPQDVKKLLSLELTGAWVNEAREVQKSIVDAIDSRLGRYPGERDGGCTRKVLLMDTNSPPEDHWWGIMSGEVQPPEWMTQEEVDGLVKPAGWEFFSQPGAVLEDFDAHSRRTGYRINPDRENRQGIKDSYYLDMIPGKNPAFVQVYLLNRYASVFDGKAVYPTFRASVHVSGLPLVAADAEILVGVDFGRTPAAVFTQALAGGRWAVLAELVAVNMGAKRFAELLKRFIARKGWSHNAFRFYGDPSGDDMSQSDDTSPFSMFRAAGVPVVKAPSNDPSIRIEAVEQLLDRMSDGGPCLLVDPAAKNLIAGFEGGYRYPRLGVSSADRYDVKPDKNRFSHPHDALQYAVLGGGEGRRVMTGQVREARAVTAQRGSGPFERRLGRDRRGGHVSENARIAAANYKFR
jgi:hypothetical protein